MKYKAIFYFLFIAFYSINVFGSDLTLPKPLNNNDEKLYRKDYKYDLLIPINYNTKPIIKNKGSAIFIHLTKNYKKTAGCVALSKKDFLILLKLINSKTKIKIL